MKRALRSVIVVLAVLLAVLALVIAGLLPLNLGLLRGPVENQLSALLGFELKLKPPLRVRLGRNAELVVGGVSLAGTTAGVQQLVSLGRLRITVETLALLRGEVLLHTITAGHVELDICALANLEFPGSAADDTSSEGLEALPPLALGVLQVNQITLLCEGELPAEPYWPRSLALTATATGEQPLQVEVLAQLEHHSLSALIETANLTTLLGMPDVLPVTIAATLALEGAQAQLDVSGSIRDLLVAPHLQASVQASVVDSATLLAPFAMALPPAWGMNELSLDGSLVASGRGAALSEVTLNLDELELKTAATLSVGEKCTELGMDLSTTELDLSVINRFLEDNDVLSGSAGAVSVAASSCATDVATLINGLSVSAEVSDLRLGWQQQELPLLLDSATAAIAYNTPGSLQLAGIWSEQALQIEVQVPALFDLMDATEWPFNLQLHAGAASLMVAGSLADAGIAPRISGTLEMEVPRSGDLGSWLGIAADSSLQLAATLAFDLQQDQQLIENIWLRAGRTQLSGQATRVVSEGLPRLALQLQGPMLDLVEIERLLPAAASAAEPTEAVATAMDNAGQGTGIRTQIEELLRLPRIDIELAIATVLAPKFQVDDLRLSGSVNDRRISDARLDLVYEEVAISGELDADLTQRPWHMEYQVVADNIDIGHLLERFAIAADVNATARRLEVDVQVHGSNLLEMVDSVQYEALLDDLHWLPKGLASADEDMLDVSRLELSGHPGELSVWRGAATYQQLPLDFLLRAPSLKQLLDRSSAEKVQLALRAGPDVMLIDAEFKPDTGTALAVRLDMSAATLFAEGMVLDELSGPLTGVRLGASLSVQPGLLQLSDIALELGSSRIQGSVDITQNSSMSTFDITLDAPFIETEDFVQPLAKLRGDDAAAVAAAYEPGTAAEAAEAEVQEFARTSSSQTGFFAMLNRRIEEFSADNHLRLKVNVAELQSAGKPLGSASAELIVDDKGVQLIPLNIDMPNGKIELNYLAEKTAAGMTTSLDLDIERFDYGGVLRLFDATSEADGILFLELAATAEGQHWDDVRAGIDGHLDFALFPENIQAGFLDLWASNLIIALLPSDDGENKKKMNCMVSRWTAEQGVVSSDNSFLDSTDIIVRVRGDIDLGQRQLDLLAAPQSKTERFLSVSAPIEVKGSFDDFSIGPAPGSFLVTMMRWYYGLLYVPWKWLTGDSFPEDGMETCYKAMGWELPELTER